MIELVNVEKTYYSKAGDIHALHKTSLSIKAGEIFGIIGLSGCLFAEPQFTPKVIDSLAQRQFTWCSSISSLM